MTDGPKSDRQVLHDRRAAALQERASQSETRVMSAEEIAAHVRKARKSGSGPTVEQAAMDASLVLAWWWEQGERAE